VSTNAIARHNAVTGAIVWGQRTPGAVVPVLVICRGSRSWDISDAAQTI